MKLTQLRIQHFRNLQPADLSLHPNINFIHGDNGAGKTSVLEAIYLLANSKSFRTATTAHTIQSGKTETTVFSRLTDIGANEAKQHTLAYQLSKDNPLKIKFDSESTKLSSVMQQLAILEIGPRSTELFYAGPQSRRQVLNWGVFHVEHQFYSTWQYANRALKQRNVLLKQVSKVRQPIDVRVATLTEDIQFTYWTEQLAEHSQALHAMRKNYLDAISPLMLQILHELSPDNDLHKYVTLRYKSGWAKENSLLQTLNNQLERDIISGYTSSGFHRADFVLMSQKQLAHEVLSRGQLKLLLYALKLAQQAYVCEVMGVAPICLLDDLSSELDAHHYAKVLDWLNAHSMQVFVTSLVTNKANLPADNYKVFHVEHGHIAEKVNV